MKNGKEKKASCTTYYKSIIPYFSISILLFRLAISNFMDPKLRISIIIFLLVFVELYPDSAAPELRWM
ncbi:hypothetical protein Lalb_Chr09g0332161 [Lupinus albus]|uniref:Uncharacterized protein n=1 Tax=Lupinus albus TaxID=3870 RepID=A0A6A4Q1Y7_LUPAL|nr:hypothetical protein Lalb_Chr09g0332161 [Lupinus albus]